jgi:pSer/pThr/pTyr-binding forkhead associated (FHA) protein
MEVPPTVTDPVIARFAEACAATGPLDLCVELADGGVLAEGTVRQPFCLVGRDEACEITLTDPDVNPRHAWLQALGGRVFAVDLGSRTGLAWPDGRTGCCWLEGGAPVRVGPFRLHLRSPVAPHPEPALPGGNPLQADLAVARTRPTIHLDFRNGKRAKDRWRVNRLVTLVGRSPECKLHLSADDVAPFHCGLVLTPAGLWVVDLSGRGVVVSGERMRVAPLPDGAELWVGRFLIGCHYASARSNPPSGPLPNTPPARDADPARVVPVPHDDEVPLGVQPPRDPALGLPSSHIMADAFRTPGVHVGGLSTATAPVSGALLVTGAETEELETPSPVTVPAVPPADTLAPLLRRLTDVQAQTFGQFDESLRLIGRLLGPLPAGARAAVGHDLARLGEVNAELGRLLNEVTGLATARAAALAQTISTSQADVGTAIDTPALSTLPADVPAGDAVEDWLFERITALQREGLSRWARVLHTLQMTNAPPMPHQ